MATYLFQDITALKASVGKAVNASMEITELGPTMLIVAEQYIIPWLGPDQWNALVAAVAANTFTPEQTALLPFVQRALSMFTMYEYSAVGEIQVSDAGFFRMETDDKKTAYKSQVNNYRAYMLANGFAALESMLKFLQAGAADYPLWANSDEATRNREAFINYASEFQRVYSTNVNRYVMETLRGLMLDVEQFAILPTIGEPFFNELKAAIAAGTVTTNQAKVIKLAQSAVAHFTIEEGIRRNIVANPGLAIVVYEILEHQGNIRQGAPDPAKLTLAIRHNDEFGNRHISRLKKFLTENAADYPTYETWVAAEAAALAAAEEAAAEAAAEALRNTDNCWNPGASSGTTSRKSIIRF